MVKYEVTLKNDFGDPNEIVINTLNGYLGALTAALDGHYDVEDEVYEIIIKRIKE